MNIQKRRELWSLSAKEFNEWRKVNDIPRLFNFFIDKLPDFNVWVNLYFPNIEYLIDIENTGKLITGKNEMVIFKFKQENDERITRIFSTSNKIYLQYKKRNIRIIEERYYTPYIQWARKRFKNKKFILSDKRNNTYTDDLSYNSWSHKPGDPYNNIACLFLEHEVLSLGNVTIEHGRNINGRNLDFLNLDYLEILGNYHGSTWQEITYSSCRGIEFKDTNLAFYTFNKCYLENLKIINSQLQDFEFYNSDLNDLKIENSRINNLEIKQSHLNKPILNNVELYNFKLTLKKTLRNLAKSDIYKRFRVSFKNKGFDDESHYYYYLEKKSIRKSLWFPFYNKKGEFPKVHCNGNLITYFKDFKSLNKRSKFFYLLDVLTYELRLIFKPRKLLKLLEYRINYLFSFFDNLMWGYGEKPFRPIRNAILIILSYATIYFKSDHPKLKGSFLDSLYFSVVTFSTLGFGDISPGNNDYLKILCSSEALLGVITMGFLIAGLSRKSSF